MAKGNVFGPASSEIKFEGFGKIGSPGAVAPPKAWWQGPEFMQGLNAAMEPVYKKGGELLLDAFAGVPEGEGGIDNVGDDVVEGIDRVRSYFQDPNYLENINFTLNNRVEDLDKTIAGLNEDAARASEMGRTEDAAMFLDKINKLTKDRDEAKKGILTEKEALDLANKTLYTDLPAGLKSAQEADPLFGYSIIDPGFFDKYIYQRDLPAGYIYRDDLENIDDIRSGKRNADGSISWKSIKKDNQSIRRGTEKAARDINRYNRKYGGPDANYNLVPDWNRKEVPTYDGRSDLEKNFFSPIRRWWEANNG